MTDHRRLAHRAIFGLNGVLTIGMEFAAAKVAERAMILNTIAK